MKVLLIDGYNMLYRMRAIKLPPDPERGINPITYTFFRSMRALVEKFRPDCVYFVMEGCPKERLALMESYKGQRIYNDHDDFRRQRMEIVDIMTNYMPIHIVRHPDYECDDVLAFYVTNKHEYDECIIVSTDTDFFQLFTRHNRLKIYNPVKKDFVKPVLYDYVAYKALKGDMTDNIPGFEGIGDKKALKLIAQPELLSSFLGKDNNRDIFERNCKLVKFHDLCESYNDITDTCASPNWTACRNKFQQMNFNSITNDMSWFKFTETFRSLL